MTDFFLTAPVGADSRQPGFTLMETLVAMMVLAICLTIIFQLFSGGLRSKMKAEDYTRGVFLTSQVMEEILATGKIEAGTLEGVLDDETRWEAVVSEVMDEESGGERLSEGPDLSGKKNILYRIDLDLFRTKEGRTTMIELTTLTYAPVKS